MTTLGNFDGWQKLFGLANIQQNGFVPPEVFINWWNEVSNEKFTQLSAEFGRSQKQSDDLAPYATSINVRVTPTPGQPFDLATLPANYEYLLNVKIIRLRDENKCYCDPKLEIVDEEGACVPYVDPDYAAIAGTALGNNLIERTITDIDNQRWGAALDHYFDKPTWDNPLCTQIATQGGVRQLKIAPKGIQYIVLDYLRTPVRAIFNYTLDASNIVIYNPTTSINLEWSNILENEFLYRVLKKYGNYVGQPALVQIADDFLSKL